MSTNRDEEGVREHAAEQLPNAESNSGSDSASGDDDSLDLEGLDLTVETVDERISPSETNVFDK